MPRAVRDGVGIHYETAGEGPPLVLHTGEAGDSRMWRRAGYAEALAGHRLILIDPRGHGLSDRPAGLRAHGIREYVQDVLAVLDAEGVRECLFWGYSDGARVGLELAAGAPGRVAGLVAMGVLDEPPEVRRRAAGVFRELGMGELVRLIQRDEGLAAPDWLWLLFMETEVEMLCLELEAWADWPGAWSAAPHVSCPALCLAGQREDPGGELAALADRMPQGLSTLLPGAGHLGAFLDVQAALGVAKPFLQGLAGVAGK
jgi:pimeloyl-ACP methyl ester carboxylesterase